jgi:uncharacterized membrane protein YeaQ/YmgE (transglycosylase-associated protein family)
VTFVNFFVGFLIWLAIAVGAGLVVFRLGHGPGTNRIITVMLAIFGAFIGGMLGVAAYVYHDPTPLRPGGLIGAILGSLFFSSVYQFASKKLV